MKIKAAKIRQRHRWFAPIMLLLILPTAITGIIYQISRSPATFLYYLAI